MKDEVVSGTRKKEMLNMRDRGCCQVKAWRDIEAGLVCAQFDASHSFVKTYHWAIIFQYE